MCPFIKKDIALALEGKIKIRAALCEGGVVNALNVYFLNK